MCENFECQNGGICVLQVDDGIKFPTCDCTEGKGGELCQFSMPAACEGNPCQNGGNCTAMTQTDGFQVCVTINYILTRVYHLLYFNSKNNNFLKRFFLSLLSPE